MHNNITINLYIRTYVCTNFICTLAYYLCVYTCVHICVYVYMCNCIHICTYLSLTLIHNLKVNADVNRSRYSETFIQHLDFKNHAVNHNSVSGTTII